jgi:hypothetical protein
MERIHGWHDLEEHEENTVQFPLLGGDKDEYKLMGARTDFEVSRSYTWAMDIPQHTNP